MSAYPSTLPPPLQSGYSIEYQNGDMELNPQAGTSFIIRQSDSNPAIFSVNWNLSQAQADVFFAWFNNDLNAGENSFTIDLLLESGMSQQTAVFVADSMTGFSLAEYDRYIVTAQLFVGAISDPDAGEYETLLGLAELDENGDPNDSLNLIDIIINEVLP